MNAEYPLNHGYFERVELIGLVLKQPMTALISKWKVSDADVERSVYTGIQIVSVIWKFWVSSLFLCKFLSYIWHFVWFLAMSGLFLCQLLPLPIFHLQNASALMQENLSHVTTDQKSQFIFNNLRRKFALVISHIQLNKETKTSVV